MLTIKVFQTRQDCTCNREKGTKNEAKDHPDSHKVLQGKQVK